MYKLFTSEWSAMAQLRFGILPLNIKTGRLKNQPIEQGICTLCEQWNRRLSYIDDSTYIGDLYVNFYLYTLHFIDVSRDLSQWKCAYIDYKKS